MRPPIVVNESDKITEAGPLYFFQTVGDAEQYLEPIDVVNEEYFAFDSEGRLLRLTVDDDQARVQISEAGAEPSHEAVLLKLLIDFFLRHGAAEDWCHRATLYDLTQRAIRDYKTR